MSFFQDLKNTYMTYEPKKRSFLSHGGSFLIFCSLVFFLFFCKSLGLERFWYFVLFGFLYGLIALEWFFAAKNTQIFLKGFWIIFGTMVLFFFSLWGKNYRDHVHSSVFFIFFGFFRDLFFPMEKKIIKFFSFVPKIVLNFLIFLLIFGPIMIIVNSLKDRDFFVKILSILSIFITYIMARMGFVFVEYAKKKNPLLKFSFNLPGGSLLENFGGFLLGPFLMDLSTIFFLPLVYFAFFYGMFPKFGILLLLGVFLLWNRKLLYRKK